MVLVRTMKLSHQDFIRNAHNWVTIVNSGLFWQLDICKMWQDLMERPDDPLQDDGERENRSHNRPGHGHECDEAAWWNFYLQWQAMLDQILNPQSLRQYRFTLAKSEVIEAYSGGYEFGGNLAAGPALIITNPQAIDFEDAAENMTASGGENLTLAPYDHILTLQLQHAA